MRVYINTLLKLHKTSDKYQKLYVVIAKCSLLFFYKILAESPPLCRNCYVGTLTPYFMNNNKSNGCISFTVLTEQRLPSAMKF